MPLPSAKKSNISNSKQAIKKPTIVFYKDKFKYIVLNDLKFTKYNNYIRQSNSNSARISICKEDLDTIILVGPLTEAKSAQKLIELFKKENSIKVIDITNKEYDQKCSFE